MMQIRQSLHRRQVEPRCPGQLCGDLAGPLPGAWENETCSCVCVRRNTRMGFVACMKDKRSETVRDACNEFKIDLRSICRFHTHRGGEFFTTDGPLVEREFDLALDDNWLRQKPTWASWPEAAGHCHTRALWVESITSITEVRNRTKQKIDDTMVVPLSPGFRGDAKRWRYCHQRRETTNSRQSRSWVSVLWLR